MTVGELLRRFPEVPRDLERAPELARYAEAFGTWLHAAREPSACATAHDAANNYYTKLVVPLAIYGLGLATREGVLGEIEQLLARYAADPDGFAATLVPAGAASREVRGPGCG